MAWTELIINLTVTLLLAPFYGIAGILIGKIISFFFISVFWKPYYLFTQGFHISVRIYWKGMTPFYIIFSIFTFLALWLKNLIIDTHTDSFYSLVVYGVALFIPLLVVFFLLLFIFTNGMKYFVARNPAIYSFLSRIISNKLV